MRGAPKILAVASAVDLDFRYGCTPAWWQLWKGLSEAGCDLIVTPYRGRPVESPWWRTEPNPCYREAELFAAARGGTDSGFNYYHGADPGEYDLLVSNSEGGLGRLRELGARRAEAVFWAADPTVFTPLPVEKEYDVFFYGFGDKFRREWMAALVGEPSRRDPEIDFALGGKDFRGDVGSARLIGDVPFNVFSQAISRGRINLNITRRSHATVYASSTCRPFELAASGAAIVSNPHEGIERWFEPGSELRVVSSADEAVAAYRELLDDPGAAEAMGRRARERVLDDHTYAHRAGQTLA